MRAQQPVDGAAPDGWPDCLNKRILPAMFLLAVFFLSTGSGPACVQSLLAASSARGRKFAHKVRLAHLLYTLDFK